jgi:hypothetical protein
MRHSKKGRYYFFYPLDLFYSKKVASLLMRFFPGLIGPDNARGNLLNGLARDIDNPPARVLF